MMLLGWVTTSAGIIHIMLIINVIIVPVISRPCQSALLSHPDLVDIGVTSSHGIFPCCIWVMVFLWVLTSHAGVILIYIVSMDMKIVHVVVYFAHVGVWWVYHLHVGGRHAHAVQSGLVVHV